ncbi:hypothetical protein Bbelb_122550 [Branchiostoma belcheri]|nr:hypothetical protein Bbelb_122550 [Branchiostoma belcheri]
MNNMRWDPPLGGNTSSFYTDQGNNSTFPFQVPEFTSNAAGSNRSSFVYVGALAILYDFPEIAIPTLMTYSMTFTFGVTGNAMIIIAVMRYCCLKTATNYLTMSLAVADLLVSLICVPFKTAELFMSYWPLGSVMCKLLNYIRVMVRGYPADACPFRVHPGWAYRVIACVWMLSLSLSAPTLYAQRLVGYKWPVGGTIYHCQEKWPEPSYKKIFSAYFATLIFLPMFIMLVAYSSTIYKLWFSTQTIQRDFDCSSCNVCSHTQHSSLSLTQSRSDRMTPSSADKSRTTPISTEAAMASSSKEEEKTPSNLPRKKPSRFVFDRETVERYLDQENDVNNATPGRKRTSGTMPTPIAVRSRSTWSLETRRNARRRVQGTVSNFQEIIRERKQVVQMMLTVVLLFLVVRMMLTVVLLFLVCWGPHVVLNVLVTFGLVNVYTQEVYAMRIAFRLLTYLNSCLNPLCYNFMSRKFRRSFKRLLPCCPKCT